MKLRLLESLPLNAVMALLLVAAAAAGPVLAAPSEVVTAAAAYKTERDDCVAGRSRQDLKTCLYEAASAHDAARRGMLLTASPQVLRDNASQRCTVHAAGPEREACLRMVAGQGQVSGSVEAGGDLRQINTVVPPAAVASAPKN